MSFYGIVTDVYQLYYDKIIGAYLLHAANRVAGICHNPMKWVNGNLARIAPNELPHFGHHILNPDRFTKHGPAFTWVLHQEGSHKWYQVVSHIVHIPSLDLWLHNRVQPDNIEALADQLRKYDENRSHFEAPMDAAVPASMYRYTQPWVPVPG